MTLASSIADDYQYIDGIESVTLTPDDGNDAVTEVQALARRISYRDLVALGAEPTSIVLHLWESTLSSTVPLKGYAITRNVGEADETSWGIIAQEYSQQTGRYRCICNKQVSTA